MAADGLTQKVVLDVVNANTGADAGTYHDLIRSIDASSGFMGSEIDPSTFKADCETLRSRMRDTRRGFINPRSSKMAIWDMTTGLALVYTATITPFEVGLALPTELNALFLVNQVVNLVFFLDIILQFFLPVPDHSGELIRDRRKIARKYLLSWFVIDFVTIIPFDILVWQVRSLDLT